MAVMIIYPAIDLKDGLCVRLYKGDMTQDTIYSDNPADQAREWASAGFNWLHVVDLNGAVQGAPVNHAAVRSILKTVDIPVQLGGGIRNMKQIEHWVREGISRIVLGSAAVNDPELVKQACKEFPGQIAVGIDSRDGIVMVHGWVDSANIKTLDLAKMFEDAGVAAIIYTDIDRDGTGHGLNMISTIALAQAVSIPVIASGGAHTLQDIQNVKDAEGYGVQGVIVGRAFYDKLIEPREALRLASA